MKAQIHLNDFSDKSLPDALFSVGGSNVKIVQTIVNASPSAVRITVCGVSNHLVVIVRVDSDERFKRLFVLWKKSLGESVQFCALLNSHKHV